MIDWETAKMIGETITVLAGVGVGAWKTARTMSRIADSVSAVPALAESVRKLEAEMKPNGGGSLRDAVNRLEHAGIRTDQRLSDLADEVRGAGPRREVMEVRQDG